MTLTAAILSLDFRLIIRNSRMFCGGPGEVSKVTN